MKKVQWLPGFLFAVSLLVILLISSFEIAMYADFGFYQEEYEKYGVLADLDMTMEDVMHVTREMMAYLRGNRENLSVTATVGGREQDFFNEQDRFHMGEVQGLFLGGLGLRIGAVAVAAASLMALLFLKADVLRILSRAYQVTVGILAAFDPAEDYMIRMLPEGLFFDFVLRIGGLFVAGLIFVMVVFCGLRWCAHKGRGEARAAKA